MKLFYTNASAKEEIGKLEGQITALQNDATAHADEISSLTGKLDSVKAELEAMTTERDEAAKALEESEASLATANASLETSNTALQVANGKLATFDADVEKAAAARFAGLGGNPLPESGKDDNEQPDIAGLTGLAKATAIHKSQSKK